jgi:hypothetical protein
LSFLRKLLPRILRRFLGRLRFPQLFVLTALLFAVDVAIPDALPLIDEILLGLVSLLLASVKEKTDGAREERLGQRDEGGSLEG